MRKAITQKARWSRDEEGDWISFCVAPEAAAAMLEDLKSGKKHQITIKLYRKKRSLDANAYFWTLLDQLSECLHIPPMEIYKQYILDVGGNTVIVPVKADRISSWNEAWCSNHDGRLTVDMGPCAKIPGYHNVRCYIGSSDYDAAQMQRLIELLMDDCSEAGIDTITQEEKAALITEWDEAYQKRQSDG